MKKLYQYPQTDILAVELSKALCEESEGTPGPGFGDPADPAPARLLYL